MTYGSWQERLARLLEDSQNIEAINYNYGFYWFARFLFPPSRYFIRQRFQDWLLSQNLHLDCVERVDFVAHSFGTHVLGVTLLKLVVANAGLLEKVNTIILAGSVLPSDFNWDRLLRDYPGVRVVNECGWQDGALIASQLGCVGTGMAGKVGFHGGVSQRFRNHFYSFGHGGFFQDSAGNQCDDFMWERWLPLLTRSQAACPTPVGPDERPTLGRARKVWLAFLNAATIPKLMLYTFAIASIPLYVWMTRLQAEAKQRSFDHAMEVSRLETRAAQAETHAAQRERELTAANLRASHNLMIREEMADAAKLSPLLENATVHKRVRQFLMKPVEGKSSPELDSDRRILDALAVVNPDLKFPSDFSKEVELLRVTAETSEEHALIRGLAEHWLMSNLITSASIPTAALSRDEVYSQRCQRVDGAFGAALKWSESDKASDSDRMFVNYAYGVVLHERGDDLKAVTYLEQALKRVEEQERGHPDEATHWFHIHALASLADACIQSDWEKASGYLKDALKIAKNDGPFILGQLHLARGWIWMSRFSLRDAQSEFETAFDDLAKAKATEYEAMDEYLWAWHGRAMVRHHLAKEAYKARREETFNEYASIMKAVSEFLDEEVRLTIKDRVDLHERWMNSGERKGDAMMLMRNECNLADSTVFEKARHAYEDVVSYYRSHKILAKPDRDALMAQILCKAATAAAILKNEGAKQLLEQAEKFAAVLPDGSYNRNRYTFYRALADATLNVCAAETSREADENAAEKTEQQLREMLLKARATRPERDDLEFLYFVAQLVEQKRRVKAEPDGRRAIRKSLVAEVLEFMTKTSGA